MIAHDHLWKYCFWHVKKNSKSVLNWAVVQNEVQDHKREAPTLTATRLSKGNWVVEGICARSTKTGVNTDHGCIKLAIKDVCEITCTFLHAYSFTWLFICVYAGVYGRFCVCVCMYASNWHRACSNKTVTQQLKSHFLIFQNFVFLFTLAGIHFYSLSVTLFMFCVFFVFFIAYTKRFMDVVKEGIQGVGVIEEAVRERVRWRQKICCADS